MLRIVAIALLSFAAALITAALVVPLEVSHNFLRQFSSAHARIGHPHRVQMDHRISFEHIKGMAE